jgi:hypothetical protein
VYKKLTIIGELGKIVAMGEARPRLQISLSSHLKPGLHLIIGLVQGLVVPTGQSSLR